MALTGVSGRFYLKFFGSRNFGGPQLIPVIRRAASLLFWGSGPIALLDWQADDLDECYRAEPAKIDRKK